MKPTTVQTLAWVLIYGGLLLLSLGLFVGRVDAALGGGLTVVAVLAVAAGAALIVVRSRMKD